MTTEDGGVAADRSRQASRRFKLLSDGHRFAILKLLADGACSVGEIARYLDAERTLVSHNLRSMRDEGLVEARRDGRRIYYALRDGILIDQNEQIFDLGCCQLKLR